MSIGSLFAGIGGFDLAARWMGWRTAWMSEIEPYACKTLKKRFPGVPNHGDITAIRGGEVEPVDILCGGFPCQDISVAGKGAGIDGERSGLWSHYARLIDEIKPRWVVAENVSALKNRGLYRVLQDLDAIGYDAEWHCIPASAVGAPHQRDRIWILAYPNRESEHHMYGGGGAQRSKAAASSRKVDALDSRRGDDVAHAHEDARKGRKGSGPHRQERRSSEAESAHVRRERQSRPDHARSRGEVVGHTTSNRGKGVRPTRQQVIRTLEEEGLPHGPGDGVSRCGDWLPEPAVGRVVDGVSSRVDHRGVLHALGNSLVPQIPYALFQEIDRVERQISQEGFFVSPVLSSGYDVQALPTGGQSVR